MTSEYDAIGHDTSPCTSTFFERSHVPSVSFTQGPTECAPPPFGFPASHANKPPTEAVEVETFDVPIGSFVVSTGSPTQVFTIGLPSSNDVVVNTELVPLVVVEELHDANTIVTEKSATSRKDRVFIRIAYLGVV
jgi:hypothetical protein